MVTLRAIIAGAWLAASGGVLLADPIAVTAHISSFPFQVSVSGVGTGGRFAGTLAGNIADFWCVDSQNSINGIPTTFTAFVTPLTNAGWDPGHTRYGTVPNAQRNWAYADLTDDALFRFRIAATLSLEYRAQNSTTAEKEHNRRVQRAIWRATDTNPPSGPNYAAEDPAVVALYQSAAAYVTANEDNDLVWSQFRIVSGWYSGGLRDVDSSGYDQVQTYLTAVPEPGSIGLLGIAAAGVLWALRRRRG
jgi:hypothetical protein